MPSLLACNHLISKGYPMELELVGFNLFNGISFGMILFLLASGLSLTMGLMGVVNLAHGAIFMIGGFFGWTIFVKLGMSYWLAVLVAALSAGFVGLAMERGFLRQLYRRINEQVMVTIGFIYVITNLSLWQWGGLTRSPFTFDPWSTSFPLGSWEYPIYRIATIGIGAGFVIGLWWLQEKTKLGAIIRSGMDDKETAIGLGINLDKINALVFFLGSALAGLGGIFGAQLLGVHLSMPWDILLLALIVLVVGGIGSIQGAFVGALVIGIVDAFLKYFFPTLAMFSIYLIMLVVLLVKPSGLLPRKVR